MGKKLIMAAFVAVCIMSCNTDNSDTQTITIDENISEIADLVGFVPSVEFDETSKGKYVGIFGHHLNQELHGKVYINAGNDTRYTALIELVNGKQLKFTGAQRSRTNPDLIYFEGKSGNFDINFANYTNPEATNVLMDGADTEAYMVLTKDKSGAPSFIILGSYVDSSDPSFFGNWDLITNPATNIATPITLMGISGTAITQEIVTMSISHAGSMVPAIVDAPDDFDTNIAVACVPAGITIPTTEPVIIELVVPFVGTIGNAISAGGQTSMINGIEATWSFNYTTPIPIAGQPETYVDDSCNAATSGTWTWNGRTGTTSAL